MQLCLQLEQQRKRRKQRKQREKDIKAIRSARIPRAGIHPGNRWYLYKLTKHDFAALKDKQQGICACCFEFKGEKLVVDHNHKTGVVRGLLCHHCNVGLGHFYESLDKLRAAVAYLEKYESTTD